ncbi:MAG: two-component system response regulator [Desulfobacteraceae bacterium 4572_88]|nr:MAG: two-component system response regulator [Desulfobacteraceae bacterium 4572_88]
MSERVLLVDDEKDFLDVMSERLRNRGFEVSTSASAMEALDNIGQNIYDAVILDIQMPGMDGFETLKQIKKKRPELQIILLTGHGTVEKGVEAIKLGAMDFLEKPADLEAISDKIKKASQNKMLIVDKANEEKVIEMLKRYGV